MSISFKKCRKEDLLMLIEVAKNTFVDTFEKVNNPKDFNNYLAKAFNKDQIMTELSNVNSEFRFIYINGIIAGYYKLNKKEAQKESFDFNALELERIYIKKEYQAQQLGTRTLEHIISFAKENKHSFLWLGVWERNLKAIDFYKKLGFQKFGEHPYQIGNDEQQDWLMKLDLY